MAQILYNSANSVLDNGKLWRKTNERFNDVCFCKQDHPPNFLVWGAVGYNYKPKIIFKKTYISEIIEKSSIIEECNIKFKGQLIFQQDNAPAHRALKTKYFTSCLTIILSRPQL